MTPRINDTPRRHDPVVDPSPRPTWTLTQSFDSPIAGVQMYEDEPARPVNYTPPPMPAPVLDDLGIWF